MEGRICQPKFHFQDFVFNFLLEFSHEFYPIFDRISFQDFVGNYQGIFLGFILKNLYKNLLINLRNLFAKILNKLRGNLLVVYSRGTCKRMRVQCRGHVYVLRGRKLKLMDGVSPTNEPKVFRGSILKKL